MARTAKKTDEALLTALACGATVENAARRVGMAERTVYRRLADPEFRRRLNRLRGDMVERTAGLLTGAGMSSVKTLVDLYQDAGVAAAVRRRAARDVLELAIRYRETADWEQRLATLEELSADRSPSAGQASPQPP